MRYVIEGTWSGYTSSQSRVVHREVANRHRAEAVRNLGCIVYSDGTRLYLDVREAKPRERVKAVNGYGSLISDCITYGTNDVMLLSKRRTTTPTEEPTKEK